MQVCRVEIYRCAETAVRKKVCVHNKITHKYYKQVSLYLPFPSIHFIVWLKRMTFFVYLSFC